MARVLPGSGLTAFWGSGFDGWGDDMDSNLLQVSAGLTSGSVLGIVDNATLTALTPADGDIYIVTDGSPANQVAVRDNSEWVAFEPVEGWRLWNMGLDLAYIYDGASWVPERDLTSTLAPYDNGTKTTGTFTIVQTNGKYQKYVNGGAHTLAPPALAKTFEMFMLITNDASAGAITSSGFTKTRGDAFTTTNAHKFLCRIYKVDTNTVLDVMALQ